MQRHGVADPAVADRQSILPREWFVSHKLTHRESLSPRVFPFTLL